MRRKRTRIIGLVAVALAALLAGLPWAWPRLFPSLLERSAAAYDRGDWDTAYGLARAPLKTTPRDREALRLMARSSVRLGRQKSARALYSNLGGLEALKAEDLYLLGLLFREKGDRDTAEQCWEKGRENDPNHAPLMFELAKRRIETERLADAANLTRRLAAQRGWEARGNLLLGQIQDRASDPAGAVASWRRGLTLDPEARGAPLTASSYRKLIARALLHLGRPDEARAEINNVLQSGSDPEASWLLSRAWLQAGQVDKATDALAHAGSYRDEHPLEPDPAPYVGSARCAECHASTHHSQQSSLHARTFFRAADLNPSLLPVQAIKDPRNPRFSHEFKKRDGQVRYEVREGDRVYRAMVDYAFGSGDRGLTLVGHDEQGRAHQLRLSRYAEGPLWDVTTGHPDIAPPEEHDLGRLLNDDDTRLCFFCHTTEPRAAIEKREPTASDHGIGCERCHGPGGNHILAYNAGFSRYADLAIARPGLATAAQSVALCSQCHSPSGGREVQREDRSSVRFQGTTLTWSRCYTESDGKLDCITCHNPHRDAESSASSYEAKCLSCHGGEPAGRRSRGSASVCPVNPATGCISCHMKVEKAFAHTSFTDHYIRIHREPGAAGTRR